MLQPRLVQNRARLHRGMPQCRRGMEARRRRQAAWRHRRGYRCGASLPRRGRARPGHVLGVQL